MSAMGRTQFIALGAAIVLTALLFMAPRIPPANAEAPAMTKEDVRIAQAVAMVNGTEPMKGIMQLRELASEMPDNPEVQWHLGMFSVQSGQIEKAAERFENVVELDAEGFPDAWFYLGRTYATLGQNDKAIANFEKYKTLIQDTVILNGVDRFLNELKSNKPVTTQQLNAER